MNTSARLLTAALAITASVSIPRIAVAQNCNYYAGQASNGQTINVDLCGFIGITMQMFAMNVSH